MSPGELELGFLLALQAGHAAKPVKSQTAKPAKAAKVAKRAAPQQQKQPKQGSVGTAELDLWGSEAAQPSTGWLALLCSVRLMYCQT